MKGLYKKISAIALAGMVVIGGVAASGVNSFAVSNKYISERSFVSSNYRGFLGDSPDFKRVYNALMKDIPDEVVDRYEIVIEKIRQAYEKRKKSPGFKYFNIKYIGLPDKVEEGIKAAGYKLEEPLRGSLSPEGIVSYLDRFRWYYEKNILVSIRYNGQIYRFILYAVS